MPILLCHDRPADEMRAYLAEQLTASPVDRLAAAFTELGVPDAGRRALSAYDRWVGMLDDKDVRNELKSLKRTAADASSVFREVKSLGETLEEGLLALLFETRLLPYVREYGIF